MARVEIKIQDPDSLYLTLSITMRGKDFALILKEWNLPDLYECNQLKHALQDVYRRANAAFGTNFPVSPEAGGS